MSSLGAPADVDSVLISSYKCNVAENNLAKMEHMKVERRNRGRNKCE